MIENIQSVCDVTVILPVYRNVDMTRQCIESAMPGVLDMPNARLLVINDFSPDAEMQPLLERFAGKWEKKFFLYENKTNCGFVRTVNTGLDYFPASDVVLLNSDVIVPEDWLKRFIQEAYRGNNIGMVTPFSNNATICSFPYNLQDNRQPFLLSVDKVDAVFRSSHFPCVPAPTGVGFCMYIRRACLDQIGYLNVERFGIGYGEENDLCQRAIKQGWLNVISPNIYAYHKGGVSFSSEKAPLVDNAMQVIDKLHPNYHIDVHMFIKEDPLKLYRISRYLQLISVTKIPKVLHISHALGGGVAQHISELGEFYTQEMVNLVLEPSGTDSVIVSLGTDAVSDKLSFMIPEDYHSMVQLFRSIGVSAIHFHHILNLPSKIYNLSSDVGVPYVFTVHDYYSLYANPTLTDNEGIFSGYYPESLDNPLYPLPTGVSLTKFRQKMAAIFSGAEQVIFPSVATKDIFKEANVYPLENEIVAPHICYQLNIDKAVSPVAKKEHYRIGVLGAINREKGADRLEALALMSRKQGLPFSFQLIGYAYRPLKLIDSTGPYVADEISKLLAQMNIDIVLFPAQWPETYSYTLSYAMHSGLPILAPSIGAFPERLDSRENTCLFPYQESSSELLDTICNFVSKMEEGDVAKAPEYEISLENNNFYQLVYKKLVSRKITASDARIPSSIELKERWLINKSELSVDNDWKETVLAAIWNMYMRNGFQKVFAFVPFKLKRLIKRSLSTRPIHEVMKARMKDKMSDG